MVLVAPPVLPVTVAMPPVPLEYQGIELARRFHAAVTFRNGRRWRVVSTRANGQPAFGAYLRDPAGGPSHAVGLITFTLAGDRVSAITRFETSVLAHFGLPRTLPSFAERSTTASKGDKR